MSEPDDLEAQLPPLVGRVRASLRGEQAIFILPDGPELAYNREEVDFISTSIAAVQSISQEQEKPASTSSDTNQYSM